MSRIDACYAHLVFSPCAVGALLKQDSIGAAGIPWRLRHSCHPTQLDRNSVHKCPKPTSRGRFRRFVYTPTASFRAVGPQAETCGPWHNPPAAWRGVARAHLPSWATFHSAPQPGGGVALHASRAATSRKGAVCATRRPQTTPFREASGQDAPLRKAARATSSAASAPSPADRTWQPSRARRRPRRRG